MEHVPGTPYRYRHGWIKLAEHTDRTTVSVPVADAKKFASQNFLWRSTEDLDQLTNSLRTEGLRRPLNVHPGIGLVDGNHRLAAAERAGLTHIPVNFHKSGTSSNRQSEVDTAAGYGLDSFYDSARRRDAEDRALQEHLDSPEYRAKIKAARDERARRQRQWLLDAAARLRREGNPVLAQQAEDEARQINLADRHVQSFIDLATTPGGRVGDASPLGKKGGPRKLTDYTREIAHALMRRGVPESRAIAIARGAQARWARGGGKVRPQVRAAAAASTAAQHVLDHNRRKTR